MPIQSSGTPPAAAEQAKATSRPPAVSTPPRRGRRRTPIIILIALVLVLGTIWWINHRKNAENAVGYASGGGRRGGFGRFGGGPNAPLPVATKDAVKGDIHVYLNALGTVTPAHIATIRTQISGQLQEIDFKEGQLVHRGDLLAIVDPRPYENALAQAQAQLQQAQAQLKTAQLDLQRYETLAKEDSIAKQQVDTTQQQVNQYEGLVETANAAIATANLNLTYCHIKAPFDGRVGLRQVDPGNYVTPGDNNGIVVLAQTKPITVIFTLPEDNMSKVSARLNSGARLPVDAFDRTQTQKVATGELESIDNQIDPTTGTFKLRALFANENETLYANQFVNIRLLVDTIHDAIVIPSSAVERGQQGTYVYIVTPEATAQARNITLGESEGELVAVTAGLQVGDKIVTDGADKLKDGQKVILNGGAGGWPGAGKAGPGEAGRKWGKGNGEWGKGNGGPPGAGKQWNSQRGDGQQSSEKQGKE